MMGKVQVSSQVNPFGKSFSRAGLPLKCRQRSGRIRANAGQSQESSTFVNFFRRAARSRFPLIPQGKSGIRQRSCQRQEEKPHSPFFPCLCRNMEEGDDFRESKTVHFCHLHVRTCEEPDDLWVSPSRKGQQWFRKASPGEGVSGKWERFR